VCAVAAPVIVVLVGGSALDIAVVSGVGVMIILRHGSNLRRLVRGEEHGLGETPGDRR
jgi:glycerol-3-phosphate acyltransferase PlsY